MNRPLAAAAFVAVLTLAVLVAAVAPSQAAALSLSLRVKPTTVSPGGAVTLSGKISPRLSKATTLAIQQARPGGAFTTIKKLRLAKGATSYRTKWVAGADLGPVLFRAKLKTTTTGKLKVTVLGQEAVQIKDFAFTPKTLTVKAWTRVTWTNGDPFDHTVTAVDSLDINASPTRAVRQRPHPVGSGLPLHVLQARHLLLRVPDPLPGCDDACRGRGAVGERHGERGMTESAESAAILVTGATSGIGRAVTLGLAARGARLVLLARDPGRAEEVAVLARRAGAASVEVCACDLSLLSSVREAAAQIKTRHQRLKVLVNDAAVFLHDRQVTAEGHERMLATNYLGPFLLTNLLLDELVAGAPSRIINVSAPSTTAPDPDDLDGERRFSPTRAFGKTKAAELQFSYALSRRLRSRGVTVNAYHPGVTRTGLMRDAPTLIKLLSVALNLTARTPERAAQGLVELALSPAFEGVTGKLIHDGKPIKAPFVDKVEAQERLWSASEKLAGLA